MYQSIEARQSAGLSFLEVSVVAFAITAVVAITVPGMNKVYSSYQLTSVTQLMRRELQVAHVRAMEERQPLSAIFNASRNQFGVDWNHNGSLDSDEISQVPADITFTPMITVTFTETGELPTGVGAISINVSTPHEGKAVMVRPDGTTAIN